MKIIKILFLIFVMNMFITNFADCSKFSKLAARALKNSLKIKKSGGFGGVNSGINRKYLVDELSVEDRIDPNSRVKQGFVDYNHDFEHHTVAEVERRLYDHLAPEHVDYNFDD